MVSHRAALSTHRAVQTCAVKMPVHAVIHAIPLKDIGKPRMVIHQRRIVHIPMRGNRADWLEAHRRAAEKLLALLEEHPAMVYPVLGDPGVYASSSYLMRLVSQKHPCRVVPGITTMCAAAAELGVPLCEQAERLTILDSFEPGEPLPEGNAVIMKSGRRLAALKEAAAGREAYAVRNLGMDNAFIGRLEDIPEDDYSYFTTVIIKGERT